MVLVEATVMGRPADILGGGGANCCCDGPSLPMAAVTSVVLVKPFFVGVPSGFTTSCSVLLRKDKKGFTVNTSKAFASNNQGIIKNFFCKETFTPVSEGLYAKELV